MAAASQQIEFLTTLQRLLEEGDFVATYKFALIMALADLAVESRDRVDGSLRIPLGEIARKFIEYYWPQAAPFAAAGARRTSSKGDALLKQNTGRQAAIIRRVAEARADYGKLANAERDHQRWRALLSSVRRTVIDMPLWRLQVMGGRPVEFLYRQDVIEDGCIVLLPNVAGHFRRFHSLIRSLVESAWMRQIRRIRANDRLLGPGTDLAAFLFGSERANLGRYQPVLRELQHDFCFYCEKRIRANPAVDHFIPWLRYPMDLGHNFVLAHAGCNNSKRDFLAADRHLGRWAARNRESGEQLSEAFDAEGLPHDEVASRHITEWAYEQAERAGALVWLREKELLYLASDWRSVM